MDKFSGKLDRLLRPQTIAVVGGHFAQAVARQCDKMEFAGKIWPVHPQRDQIENRPCYRDILSLPGAPDATFIGVNRYQTVGIVEQLNQIDAGGAVCYASGFKETGDSALNDQLLDAAQQMPVLGPNCYGFINYLDGALLWPDQHGGKRRSRGVAVLMQSSNIGINLTMNKRATPIAYMIALGNQALVGMSDMIVQLCQDERVTAIGLHIEGLDDLNRFCSAVQVAHQHNKPIVVLKSGKSEKGAAITLTHTASLASDDKVMTALFDRLGIAAVTTLTQFLETLKLLHVNGALPDNNLVSLSCSGGEASLICDAAQHYDVVFSDFSEQDVARIKPTVHELVSISNPFDYHTFDWANYDRLNATFNAVMQSGFSLNALVMDFPREDRCEIDDWQVTLAAWQNAAQQTASRTAVVATLAETMPEQIAEELMDKRIVPLCGIENALATVEAAASIDFNVDRYTPWVNPNRQAHESRVLNEYLSKQKLVKYSVPVAESKLCESVTQAIRFANDVGYPVAAKAVGSELAHKTELGAVKLNLTDDVELERAVGQLQQHSRQCLVEKMIDNIRAELIVGVNRDPVLGLYQVIGAGGVFTELLDDSVIVLFPFTREHIESALDKLKIFKLLSGYRNQPPVDIEPLVQTLVNIQEFVKQNRDTMIEMDINPLIVCNDGRVFAADALIRINQP